MIGLPNNVSVDLQIMIGSPENAAGQAFSTFPGDWIML